MKLMGLIIASVCIVLGNSPLAFAHPDPNATATGLSAGLAHPLSGWDHMLAMIGIGLLASRIGGLALWLLPTAFLTAMVTGGFIGVMNLSLGFVEAGIAASLIAIGAALMLNRGNLTVVLSGLSALFGWFHGHAHGTEMPAFAAPMLYSIGFLVSTAGLLGAGVLVGQLTADSKLGSAALRWSGAGVSALGVAMIISGV